MISGQEQYVLEPLCLNMDKITQEICTSQAYIAEERKHRGLRFDQLWDLVNARSEEFNMEITCNLYAKIMRIGWRGAVDHPDLLLGKCRWHEAVNQNQFVCGRRLVNVVRSHAIWERMVARAWLGVSLHIHHAHIFVSVASNTRNTTIGTMATFEHVIGQPSPRSPSPHCIGMPGTNIATGTMPFSNLPPPLALGLLVARPAEGLQIGALLSTCVDACQRGCTEIRSVQAKRHAGEGLEIELKNEDDVKSALTEADCAAQAAICGSLRAEWGDALTIIGEEDGDESLEERMSRSTMASGTPRSALLTCSRFRPRSSSDAKRIIWWR